jgi:hypothetical protein
MTMTEGSVEACSNANNTNQGPKKIQQSADPRFNFHVPQTLRKQEPTLLLVTDGFDVLNAES